MLLRHFIRLPPQDQSCPWTTPVEDLKSSDRRATRQVQKLKEPGHKHYKLCLKQVPITEMPEGQRYEMAMALQEKLFSRFVLEILVF